MPRYIDADSLNVAIEKWFDGVCVYDVSPSEAVYDFQSIVDEQPTISPDEALGVGKWIEDEDQNHVELTFRCSECGRKAVGRFEKTRYCGDCGAKMEVSE